MESSSQTEPRRLYVGKPSPVSVTCVENTPDASETGTVTVLVVVSSTAPGRPKHHLFTVGRVRETSR